MDYTVNLKKILPEKQFAYLQSISASLRTVMSPELFNHSIGTFNYCFQMADRFLLTGANSNLKDSISGSGRNRHEKTIPELCFDLAAAAILHDYGKIFSIKELKTIAVKEKLGISDFELNCEPILHSFMAPFLLERDFKITDRDVLNSVRIHTTGSVKMSMTDKILYISDKIEETRDYEGVEKLRYLSLEDINLCLLEVYKSNIIYVIKGNNVLHPDTAKIWNYIHGGLRNAI
jgi:predicted HD superfamily hydrolase involved in NAD metabolism